MAKLIADDDQEQRRHVDAMLRLFLDMREEYSTPEISGRLNRYLGEHTGWRDFFVEEKRRSTEIGLEVLPNLRRLVEQSADPFVTALLLAVSGNLIDYGIFPDFVLENIEERIVAVFNESYDRASAKELERRMTGAENIVYVLDNCGEAVVDRLLIERFPGKITVAVRGAAVFNDAMREDALASGISAPIIDSGAGMAGVSRKFCSREFIAALDAADLVVAKGQGNFESMEECGFENIFFLLRVKCPMVAGALNAPLNSLQIINRCKK